VTGPWTPSSILRPVLDRLDFFVVLEPIKDSEAVYDQLPSAIHIAADFTFPFGGASAGTVEYALRKR
jgi:hypothetical protein